MTTAIGGVANAGAAGAVAAPRARGLDAELAKFEGQLSDCVHCASATTTQGKAKIDAISAKINAIREKIKQTDHVERAVPAAPAAKAQSSYVDIYA